MSTKQLEVQIMGQSYLLGCPEGGESKLLDAVEKVDTAMCRIRDAGKIKARDRIAVLAALNLAFELSEREAMVSTSTAPAASSLATPRNSAPSPASGLQNPDSDARLGALLQRLDGALGGDGHLL